MGNDDSSNCEDYTKHTVSTHTDTDTSRTTSTNNNSNSTQHTKCHPDKPPLEVVQTESISQLQRRSSADNSTDTGTDTNADTNINTPDTGTTTSKRPFGGIVTLLFLLLTGGGIALFAPHATRKYALIIYLPIYCTCLLAYIIYLCCVNNEGELALDEYDPEPAVLKEYLLGGADGDLKKSRSADKKKKKGYASPRLTFTKTLSMDTDERAIANIANSKLNSIAIANGGADGDGDGDAYQDHDHNHHSQSPKPRHRQHNHHHRHHSHIHNQQDENTSELSVANFFQEQFPFLSQSFQGIEAQFHGLATKVRYKIRPPHQCIHCQAGVGHGYGVGSVVAGTGSYFLDSNGMMNVNLHSHGHSHGNEGDCDHDHDRQDAISTVCAYGHHDHGDKHDHHAHDKFQNPHTDVENYMPDDYDYTTTTQHASIDTDLSYDGTSLRTHDIDLSIDDSTRFNKENIPLPPPTTPKPYINLTGKYKLVHNHNFDAFLKSQNVPMLLRKAANASRPIHTIVHNGTCLRIQVDGIVKGDTTFEIGGPPAQSNIRYLKFDDHVSYVENGQAVEVRKVAKNAPNDGAVELVVKRMLGNGGHNLVLMSKARFANGDESLESVQTFHRID